jgi:hypothetical protein
MKNHNINGPKKRPANPAVFDEKGRQTVASMKYDKIDKDYLTKLLLEHKRDVELYGKGYPVSDDLATAIQVVIKKTAGMMSWRKYTDTWKEEMYARAQFCALKYCHSFDPSKMAENSKNKDPYYYLGQIVTRAFMQQVTDLKKKSKYIKFTSLNENILHTCVNIDEYAGVLEREEQREKDEINGNLAIEHNDLTEAVDILDKVDPYIDSKVTDLAKKLVDEEGIDEESAIQEAKRIIAAKKKKDKEKAS